MSEALKALKYAEENLGVHKVYDDAHAGRLRLDDILTDLGKARDRKRDLEFRLHDTEMEIASAEYGKHPDMAQTRMDKHLKQALSKDDSWRELREQLSKITGDIEGLEYDRAVAEVDIKIAISRMSELGGYLVYLAEIKRAANTATPVKPTTPESENTA